MNKPVLWILAILLAGAFTYLIMNFDEIETSSSVTNTISVVKNTANKMMKDDDADEMGDDADEMDDDADEMDDDADEMDDDADEMDDDADEMDDSAIDLEVNADTEPVGTIITHDGYVEYSEDAVKDALAKGKNVALFFHATWCPTCAVLEEDLLENEKAIDEDTIVFKVNYDTATDLKTKYVVTSQHTVVYLDANMDATTSVKGINTTKELLEKFQ